MNNVVKWMYIYYIVNILIKEESFENENIFVCSNENIGCLWFYLKIVMRWFRR